MTGKTALFSFLLWMTLDSWQWIVVAFAPRSPFQRRTTPTSMAPGFIESISQAVFGKNSEKDILLKDFPVPDSEAVRRTLSLIAVHPKHKENTNKKKKKKKKKKENSILQNIQQWWNEQVSARDDDVVLQKDVEILSAEEYLSLRRELRPDFQIPRNNPPINVIVEEDTQQVSSPKSAETENDLFVRPLGQIPTATTQVTNSEAPQSINVPIESQSPSIANMDSFRTTAEQSSWMRVSPPAEIPKPTNPVPSEATTQSSRSYLKSLEVADRVSRPEGTSRQFSYLESLNSNVSVSFASRMSQKSRQQEATSSFDQLSDQADRGLESNKETMQPLDERWVTSSQSSYLDGAMMKEESPETLPPQDIGESDREHSTSSRVMEELNDAINNSTDKKERLVFTNNDISIDQGGTSDLAKGYTPEDIDPTAYRVRTQQELFFSMVESAVDSDDSQSSTISSEEITASNESHFVYQMEPVKPNIPRRASFSPVRSAVKDYNSTSSSPYLASLKGLKNRPFTYEKDPITDTRKYQKPLQAARVGSFSPVRATIKNVNSTSSSPYLATLRGQGIASFDFKAATFAAPTKVISLKPEKRTTPLAAVYPNQSVTQRTSADDLFSSTQRAKPTIASFAPVRSRIQDFNATSSSPYFTALGRAKVPQPSIETLKPTVTTNSILLANVGLNDENKLLRPMGASFSPVRSSIRNMDSTSSSPYLDAIRGLTMKSFEATPVGSVPANGVTQIPSRPPGASFSPVRSTIKNVDSTGSSPYLDTLKGRTMASFDSLYSAKRTSDDATPFTTTTTEPVRPVGASFSPVRSSIRNMDSTSSSPYLDAIRGLTMKSFEATPVSSVPANGVTQIPSRPPGASFSPVRSTIKNVDSTGSSPYLDTLKGRTMASFDSLYSAKRTSDDATPFTTTTTEPVRPVGASFSPVRSSIRNMDSTSSSPYLDAIRGLTMKSFEATPVSSVPANGVTQIPSRPPGASFSPVRSTIKNVDSTGSSPYLDSLKGRKIALFDSNVENRVSDDTTDAFATLSTTRQEFVRPSGVSFSPVRASIKDMDSRSSSPYLEGLKGITMKSFEATPVTSVPVDAVTTQAKTRPPGASFSTVRSSLTNIDTTGSTPYLDALKGHTIASVYVEGSSVSPARRTINALDSMSSNAYLSSPKEQIMISFHYEGDVGDSIEKHFSVPSQVSDSVHKTSQEMPLFLTSRTTVDATLSGLNVSERPKQKSISVEFIQSSRDSKTQLIENSFAPNLAFEKGTYSSTSVLQPSTQNSPLLVQRFARRVILGISDAYLTSLKSNMNQASSQTDMTSEQSGDLHQDSSNSWSFPLSSASSSEKHEGLSTDQSSAVKETSEPRFVVSSNLSDSRPTPENDDFRELSSQDNRENNRPASQDLQIWLNEARKHAPLLQAGPDKPDLKKSVRMMSSPIASPYLANLISSPRQESPKPHGSTIVHKKNRRSPRNGGGPDAADLKHKVRMSSSSSNPYLDSLRQD
jgi:hypothetical protein